MIPQKHREVSKLVTQERHASHNTIKDLPAGYCCSAAADAGRPGRPSEHKPSAATCTLYGVCTILFISGPAAGQEREALRGDQTAVDQTTDSWPFHHENDR